MAKNEKNEDKKPPAGEGKPPAAEEQVRVKILITAQGPELRLMAGHVELVSATLAAALIKAGSAEKVEEKKA